MDHEPWLDVNEVSDATLVNVRRDAGVPEHLGSCHTARVGGYVVEGHVPADAIRRLVAERPEKRR